MDEYLIKEFLKWVRQYSNKFDKYNLTKLSRLDLSGQGIREIPYFFNDIHFPIDLSNNEIKVIPEEFIQNNILCLSDNKIKRIPKNFIQKSHFILARNQIEIIPENYVQRGILDLYDNEIKEIPKGFKEDLVCKFDISFNLIEKIDSSAELKVGTYNKIIDEYLEAIMRRSNQDNFIKSIK